MLLIKNRPALLYEALVWLVMFVFSPVVYVALFALKSATLGRDFVFPGAEWLGTQTVCVALFQNQDCSCHGNPAIHYPEYISNIYYLWALTFLLLPLIRLIVLYIKNIKTKNSNTVCPTINTNKEYIVHYLNRKTLFCWRWLFVSLCAFPFIATVVLLLTSYITDINNLHNVILLPCAITVMVLIIVPLIFHEYKKRKQASHKQNNTSPLPEPIAGKVKITRVFRELSIFIIFAPVSLILGMIWIMESGPADTNVDAGNALLIMRPLSESFYNITACIGHWIFSISGSELLRNYSTSSVTQVSDLYHEMAIYMLWIIIFGLFVIWRIMHLQQPVVPPAASPPTSDTAPN